MRADDRSEAWIAAKDRLKDNFRDRSRYVTGCAGTSVRPLARPPSRPAQRLERGHEEPACAGKTEGLLWTELQP